MKHYIILFVEAKGPIDTWFTRHYVAEAEDKKDIPQFILPHGDPNYQTMKKLLAEDGFIEVSRPTYFPKDQKLILGFSIEEIILGGVKQISAFFFNEDESFRKYTIFFGETWRE